MNKSYLLFLVVIVLSVFSCSDDDASPDPPELNMAALQIAKIEVVGVHDAMVNCKLSKLPDDPIEDHGFVYATENISSLQQGVRIPLGPVAELKEFSSRLTGLEKTQKYFVRAYAATADTVVFSTEISLTTKDVNQWFTYPISGDLSTAWAEFWGSGVEVDAKAYAGFGIRSEGGVNVIPLYEYDPLTNILKKMPHCPVPHTYHTKRFGVGDDLYIGFNNSESGGLKEIWQFNTTVKEWTQRADFPYSMQGVHTFNLYNQAYIIGNNDDNSRAAEMWQYDQTGDQWQKLSTMPFYVGSIPPDVHGVMQLNSKLYIIVALVAKDPQLYEYDPLQNKYTVLNIPPMILPEGAVNNYALSSSAHGFFFIPDKNEIWQYEPAGDTWAKMEPPISVTSKAFILNDVVYLVDNAFHMYVPE